MQGKDTVSYARQGYPGAPLGIPYLGRLNYAAQRQGYPGAQAASLPPWPAYGPYHPELPLGHKLPAALPVCLCPLWACFLLDSAAWGACDPLHRRGRHFHTKPSGNKAGMEPAARFHVSLACGRSRPPPGRGPPGAEAPLEPRPAWSRGENHDEVVEELLGSLRSR